MMEIHMELGDIVTDFTAPSTRGQFTLAARRGRWIVLYFYPKDNTSACTLEGQEFTAAQDAFAALNADIVGISRDGVKTHENFCNRHGVGVELISDKEEALCTQFDVIKNKIMYGKPCRGINRSTFLIDPDGKLAAQWKAVKVPGHVQAVLNELKALQNAI